MALLHRLGLAALLLTLASTAHAQTLLVAADHSLTAAEYAAKGMPPIGHPWHEDELRRAVGVLHKIAADDPLKLPRLGSTASGAVFARLVAPLLLPHAIAGLPQDGTATTLPREPTTTAEIQNRIADLSGYAQPLGALALLYAKPLAGDFCFDAELVESTRVALEVNGRMLLLINRARAVHGATSPPPWLRQAHQQVSYGTVLTIRGALFIYAARRAFRPQWRAELATVLQNWVPTLMSLLPQTTHAEMLAHLHGLMLEDPQGYADWQQLQHAMTFAEHGPPAYAKVRPPRRGRHKRKK